jgi:hypothetical protein
VEENFRGRRPGIAIIAGAALLLLGAFDTPRTAPWYDYSAMLKILSDSAALRYPTAEELKAFPVLWPTVPVEENAAFYYAKAVRLLKDNDGPPGSPGSGILYAGDLAALEAWVAANKPALDMAVEAQSHPVCRMPIFICTADGMMGPTKGYPNPCPSCFASLRQLGRCFGDAGLAEELNGRPHGAVEPYLACVRMGAQFRNGVTIQSRAGCAIVATGATPLDRLVANATLPDDDLRKIIQACSEAETRPGEIADSVECEAEYAVAYLCVGGFRERIAKITLDILNGTSRAIAAARKDADLPIYEVINNPAAQLFLHDETAYEGNKALSQFWQWRERLSRVDTQLRVLQIRAAIARYERRHGKLPETLDALCPEFLSKVPLDPFSGKPLRYRITKEGWLVWSVGMDLTDTGGAVFIGEGDNRRVKDGIFTSRVYSKIELIRLETNDNTVSVAEDQETPADAAAQTAQGVDRLGLTPLHRAANRGDLAAVEALLAKGADVNALALAKQTPLHLAVTQEIAQLLISKGALIEARDRWGRTPLFWAAGAGRKDVVETLLAGGAQPDAPELTDTEMNAFMSQLRSQLPAQARAGIPEKPSPRTSITYAAEQGHEDIAEMLRKCPAEHPAK